MKIIFELNKIFKSSNNLYFLVGYLQGEIDLSREYSWEIFDGDILLGKIKTNSFRTTSIDNPQLITLESLDFEAINRYDLYPYNKNIILKLC
jgi:hypothetical protein